MFTTIRSQCDFNNEKSLRYFKLLRKVSTWVKFALLYLFLVQNVNYSISEVVEQQAVDDINNRPNMKIIFTVGYYFVHRT